MTLSEQEGINMFRFLFYLFVMFIATALFGPLGLIASILVILVGGKK